MDDYISRQTAIDVAIKMFNAWYGHSLLRTNEIRARFEQLPSADVQAVKRGYWIHDGLDIPHGVDWMHCSECGKRDKYCPAAMTNYCPNCGAKMNGEQND
jgi:hypothetical protein